MKLHLGVIDMPYSGEESVTTGEVAGYLEEKYQVMDKFFDKYGNEIAQDMAADVSNAIDNIMNGLPVGPNIFGDSMGEIERKFKFEWLDKMQVEQAGIEGVPTKAALKGVNHRLKLKKGARRQSFIDTGQYQADFKAWVEE